MNISGLIEGVFTSASASPIDIKNTPQDVPNGKTATLIVDALKNAGALPNASISTLTIKTVNAADGNYTVSYEIVGAEYGTKGNKISGTLNGTFTASQIFGNSVGAEGSIVLNGSDGAVNTDWK